MSDILKERWMQWVALTTTILAVCAAISTLRASTFSTRATIATTEENNNWSYFQSKSIKQHECEMQRDLFRLSLMQATDPQTKAFIEERIKSYEADTLRYDTEKAEIKGKAESIAAVEITYKQHSASFGLAAMLLQIAIMMSSVAVLIKRRALWAGGLVLGLAGILYLANGFFMWFG